MAIDEFLKEKRQELEKCLKVASTITKNTLPIPEMGFQANTIEKIGISLWLEYRRSQNHTGDHSARQISDAQQKFIKDLMRKGGQRAADIAIKQTKPLEALTSDEASDLIEKLKGGESKTK